MAKKAKKKAKKKAAKKKPSKKATKKKVVGRVAKKKKKKLLGDRVYVVEPVDEGHRVHKIAREGEERESYLVTSDGVCECKASEYHSECKHIDMVNGTYEMDELLNREQAAELVDEYVEDVLRPENPRALIVNLVKYKKQGRVGNGTALACGVLSDKNREQLTLWTVYKGLLIRVHCFRELDRYRAVLSRIRQGWSG